MKEAIINSNKQRRIIQNFATNRIARVWYNNKGFHAMPTYLNVMNNAILRANVKERMRGQADFIGLSEAELDLKTSEYGITVSNHPMNQTNNYLSTEYLLQGYLAKNELIIFNKFKINKSISYLKVPMF